jgi:hypothetical protein
MAFRFKFGILPKRRTFALHWTNKLRLRRMFAIHWTNDRQTGKNPNLSCLGFKTCFISNLRLMFDFSRISRLWNFKEICLTPLSFLVDPCDECWASDSQTRWFYGTRCRNIPKSLITQVKKATKSN